MQECSKRVKAEVGEVSILVNNAGVVSGRKILSCSEDKIKKTFEVNLLAHFWVSITAK